MKRIYTIVLILVLGTALTGKVVAQKYTIQGGLSLSTMLSKDDDDTYSNDYSMRPGFHFGILTEKPINPSLSFQTGAVITTKGFKLEDEIVGTNVEFNINLLYLDIPLLLKAGSPLQNGGTVFALFGGYVGYGLNGKAKITVGSDSEEEDINWGSDENDDDFMRLDFGLSLGAGIETSKVIISASYDLGLANISAYQDNGATVKNRVLKLSVGFKL